LFHQHHRLLHAILALSLLCGSHALAAVRHVHLPYANGKVDFYSEASQCVIVFNGMIDKASIKAMADGFRQLPLAECSERIMVLNSLGGVPGIAYGYGELLRKYGFDTEVSSGGLCSSACAYLFLSGRKRFIDDKSRYGVHQHTREGVCSTSLTEREEQRLRKVADPSVPAQTIDRLIELIVATDCKGMSYVSPQSLVELSIANTRQSQISNSIQSAIETQELQEIERFRAAASGPWRRSGGGKTLTVFTRGVTEPPPGGRPAVWGLINHAADRVHAQTGATYRSYEALHEANCEKQTLNVILAFYTSEAMGEGRIVWKAGKLPPTPVKPKTPAEIIYKMACGSAVSGS
jgi:hypothetical protein